MGYEAGADDYMTKPFSLSVLLLKIEAHFRRRKNEPGTPKIHSKDIVFIPGEMRAFVKEREISLTKNELKMLSFFLQNPKQILSKTQLLENVFDLDGDFMDENTVAVNIRRLREKIEEDPAAPVYIKNIRGLGYIWDQEVKQFNTAKKSRTGSTSDKASTHFLRCRFVTDLPPIYIIRIINVKWIS